jgi:hypothetical protein
VFSLPSAYALDDIPARESDSDFITVYLHGWSNAIAGYPVTLYEPGEFEPARERAENFGQFNIMHYQFSNMADKDSDTFIRELGDFNVPAVYDIGAGIKGLAKQDRSPQCAGMSRNEPE